MRLERSFMVPRSPQETFDYLADVENEPRWNPWGIEVHKLSAGPIGPNARFSGRYKRIGEVEQWLSIYEPPTRLRYQSKTMDGRMTFELEPASTGTRVRLVAEAFPGGPMKLLDPLIGVMMGSHISDLAKGIERELGSGPDPRATTDAEDR
ncbi:MAG: SRPBCC family protein [Candidatus Limnocylindria bacterium]